MTHMPASWGAEGWQQKQMEAYTVTMGLDRRRKRGKSVKEIGKRNDLRRSSFSFT